MCHTLLTIAIPFDTQQAGDVDILLNQLGNPACKQVRDSLRGSAIHFISITVLRDSMSLAFLLIEANLDGNEDEAIQVIVDRFTEHLRPILRQMGYTNEIPDLRGFLLKYTHRVGLKFFDTPGLSFVGSPGMTTARVKAEYELARWCRCCLDPICDPVKLQDIPSAVVDAAKAEFAIDPLPVGTQSFILNVEGEQFYQFDFQGEKKTFTAEGVLFKQEPKSALDRLRILRHRVQQVPSLADLLKPEDVTLLGPESPSPSLLTFILTGIWMAISGAMTIAGPFLLAIVLPTAILILATGVRKIGVYDTIISTFVVLTLLCLTTIIAIALTYVKFIRMEQMDIPDESLPDSERLQEVTRREDEIQQNHLFGVSEMKTDWFRTLSLRVAFWIVTQFVTRKYRPGFLGDIGTIHFARWILLPQTNKLLFFSNYSGSWDSYLEDFITKAHRGLTSIWSNTIGFPKTVRLLGQGATDGDRFKRWARRQQYPTRFWYSAYPHLTAPRIRTNAAIRMGLASASTEDEATTFWNLFGSQPPRSDTVETNEVQKIAFGNLRPLLHATCLLLRFPKDNSDARKWLKNVLPKISFGDGPVGDSATLFALTRTGLEGLGLDRSAIQTFPTAFTQGMPARAKVLGDTGEDRPNGPLLEEGDDTKKKEQNDGWLWGNDKRQVDAAIVLYTRDHNELQKLHQQIQSWNTEFHVQVVHEIPMETLPDDSVPVTEPFGFVDGVSQPIIRGLGRGARTEGSIHEVEPGEFLLGYKDNRGYFPFTPTILANHDPHNLLPTTRWLSDESADGSHGLRASVERDLGRNGSYLVIRQLKQDVEKFKLFLKVAAQKLAASPFPGVPDFVDETKGSRTFTRDEKIEHWIAAKMIGRWRDGTSLVNSPNRPGRGWFGEYKDIQPDNLFRLGAEDPLGQRCPLGAHIRRGNPRDSQTPGSDEQIAINNRHRILRIGRPYEILQGDVQIRSECKVEKGPECNQEVRSECVQEKGLLFMCLNGDIERQFEFIQQTWMMSKNFHGLDGEVDPVIGRGGDGGRITVPTTFGPLNITGVEDFVTTRGGGYFFLPGLRTLRYLADQVDYEIAIQCQTERPPKALPQTLSGN